MKRVYEHSKRARKGEKSRKANWIRSLLKRDLKPVAIVLMSSDEDHIDAHETWWITWYRPFGKLTNITDGGLFEGKPHGDIRMASRLSWKNLTPEQRRKRTRPMREAVSLEQRSAWSRAHMDSLTPEQRSAMGRHAQSSMTPEQRAQGARARLNTIFTTTTTEQRKAWSIAANSAMSPEERREYPRAFWATFTPEQRSEAIRARWAKITPEKRSAQALKAWATRRAKAAKGAF